MTERPIIFSAPMVRAILDGRKTQTRRILRPATARDLWFGTVYENADGELYRLPYAVGDRLWVREACRAEEKPDGSDGVRYFADDAWRMIENTPEASEAWVSLFHYRGRGKNGIGKPVPSIHMPRWASRITLEVTAVKVERLQDLNRGDAMEEGCPSPNMAAGPNPRDWFEDLWNSLHGPDAWAANPWVAAITFQGAE